MSRPVLAVVLLPVLIRVTTERGENRTVTFSARFQNVSGPQFEPPKNEVLAWRPGSVMPRKAYAIVRRGKHAFEAIVDLTADQVASWSPLTDVQPNWTEKDFKAVVDKVLEPPDFISGLEARGITDPTFLDCSTGPPGYFGTEEERGRRIGNVRCSEPRGVRNAWTRQVEGLSAVVDLDSEEVLRVVDDGPVPITSTDGDFDRTTLKRPREVTGPLDTLQALGPGFAAPMRGRRGQLRSLLWPLSEKGNGSKSRQWIRGGAVLWADAVEVVHRVAETVPVRDTPTPLGIRYSFTGDGEPAKLSIVLGGQCESKQRE